MKQGKQTAAAARALTPELAGRGLKVLYDHGMQGADPPDCMGEIVCSVGADPGHAADLAKLDIAVVRRDTYEALVLLEVEESTPAPKL